jgi:hypothetical protein
MPIRQIVAAAYPDRNPGIRRRKGYGNFLISFL